MKHGGEKTAYYAFMIWLKGEEKGGDSLHHHADETELDGQEGIGHGENQGKKGQQKGKNGFDQKQGGGPGDVVDHPASLHHHAGQGGKIGIQQLSLIHI